MSLYKRARSWLATPARLRHLLVEAAWELVRGGRIITGEGMQGISPIPAFRATTENRRV